MFPSNVKKYAFLGGVSKVKFNGTVYEPDADGTVTLPTLPDMTPLIVNQSTSGGGTSRTMDKTWQEIHDKFVAGASVLVTMPNQYGDEDYDSVVRVIFESPHIYAVWTSNGWRWICPTASGKPVYTYNL